MPKPHAVTGKLTSLHYWLCRYDSAVSHLYTHRCNDYLPCGSSDLLSVSVYNSLRAPTIVDTELISVSSQLMTFRREELRYVVRSNYSYGG